MPRLDWGSGRSLETRPSARVTVVVLAQKVDPLENGPSRLLSFKSLDLDHCKRHRLIRLPVTST